MAKKELCGATYTVANDTSTCTLILGHKNAHEDETNEAAWSDAAE